MRQMRQSRLPLAILIWTNRNKCHTSTTWELFCPSRAFCVVMSINLVPIGACRYHCQVKDDLLPRSLRFATARAACSGIAAQLRTVAEGPA